MPSALHTSCAASAFLLLALLALLTWCFVVANGLGVTLRLLLEASEVVGLSTLVATPAAVGCPVTPCALSVALLVGVVASHLAALVGGAVERLHHKVGILLRHLDV